MQSREQQAVEDDFTSATGEALELSSLSTSALGQFGDAKVEHLHAITTEPVWFEPDVFRFQIAMDNSLLVRFVHGGANLFENINHPIQRQSFLFHQDIAERAAVEILHHQIRDRLGARLRETEVGNVDNIWMAQPPRGAGFALEARDKLFVAHELRRDQFERDVALGAEVRGKIHCAHSAASEQSLQAILFVEHLTDVRICVHAWKYATA